VQLNPRRSQVKETLHKLLQSLSSNTPDLPFSVRFWDGKEKKYGRGEPAFTLVFHDRHAVRRVAAAGILGFGEEYMTGRVDVEGDFQTIIRLGTDRRIRETSLPLLTRLSIAAQRLVTSNRLRRSPLNVAHHYSRGNNFYKLYLDESMTYSCAYFKTAADPLELAQQQKYEHICRKLQLREGESLLDVGCGWGGMLIHAAREYGARPTGCTLSEPQFNYAREMIRNRNLQNQVSVLLQDYRVLTGTFDKWVSIGMFEHVGKKYIPLFMRTAARCLVSGGIGLLHTIGTERESRPDPWTMKYIFPGGYIPTLDQIISAMGDVGLVPIDFENLRMHYAATLDRWAERFERNAGKAKEMFGESFVRMWRMFLHGSAAGFRWGDLRLYQITFINGLNNALPLTRNHLYAVTEPAGQAHSGRP
jgi:cyclopropane-fatty-acyl-phospholipid synthase